MSAHFAPDEVLNPSTTLLALDEAMVEAELADQPRGHLGLSQIGSPDKLGLWLGFRWCLPRDLPARTLRIFALGDMIEDYVVRQLQQTHGIEVADRDPKTRKQWRVAFFGGHCGGSMDGIIRGVVESPKVPHVLECKSAKASSYNEFVKKGLRVWNFTYYTQAQCYMGAFDLTRCYFVVYNKDTSDMHVERVKVEPGIWEQCQIKAQSIIEMTEPPEPWYTNENHYDIKHMRSRAWKQIYFGLELPEPNCRNCVHSRPLPDGDARWYCARWQRDRNLYEQRAGCDLHLFIPALLNTLAIFLENHETLVRYKTTDGAEFWNVENKKDYAPDAMVFTSHELWALAQGGNLNAVFFGDPLLNDLRRRVDGEFTQ